MPAKARKNQQNILKGAEGKVLNLSSPLVMGIINLTPDSFYDGDKRIKASKILKKAERHINQGATILDLGAVSTRPGAKDISIDEELRRLIPWLKLIRNTFPEIFISVDTWQSEVARAAAELGCDMINDISGGTFDKKMFDTVAEYDLPYVLMHTPDKPAVMQKSISKKNMVKTVGDFFANQITLAKKTGVRQIIIDPGFGFGKTLEQNYQLLAALEKISPGNYPVLVGLSRKSMINKVINSNPDEALNGTTVLQTIALLNGAKILRTHDVKEAMEAVKLVGQYKKAQGK